jgi:sugar diacid utilization regulator
MSAADPPQEVESAVGRLVAVATRSDRVADLLPLLSSTLHRSMGVTDSQGHPVASASASELARIALARVLAQIERDLAGTAPTGWQVLPLQSRRDPVGLLVLRADPAFEPGEHVLVEVARSLIADQLRRASMTARILEERRSALKRTIIGDRHPTVQELMAAGERADMTLADRYWPAIVSWEPGEMGASLLSDVEALVHRQATEHVAVREGAHALVLLLAQDSAVTAHEAEAEAASMVERVVALVGARLPCSRVRGILAKAGVPLADVAVRVEELRRLSRYLERRHAPIERQVHSESTFAFLGLVAAIDRRCAAAFVAGEIGPLLSYDRAHGMHLTDVLELALDLPNRAEAARAAYMHRNTFRRYLRHATELVDRDLDDPDERLAVHVALKLTDLLGIPRDRPFPDATLGRDPDPVRAAPGGLTRHGGWSESPFRS